jgi:hypothetical protein
VRHFFSNLRAGVIKTDKGWNVKDFAVAVMNPNSQEITVTWKLISDDPKFVFRGGSVGTWTRSKTIPPMSGYTYNVYGAYSPAFWAVHDPENEVTHYAVSRLTNFKGSTEFSSSLPFYVFSGHQFEIQEGTSADPDSGWYSTWNASSFTVPVTWDPDLKQFVIPYTCYWHNVLEFPVGWHSTLFLKNNTDQTITYSIKHVPDYGTLKDPKRVCSAAKYQAQTVEKTLEKGQTLSTTLESLFGWPTDQASMMEGILLIRPNPIIGARKTLVTSSVVPNTDGGTGLCPYLTP